MVRIIGIIATKNRNDLLKNALNSAINQTHKLDELIVVSDSDDDAFEKDRSLCEGKCIFIRDIYTRNYAGNLNTAIDSLVLRHIIENGENIFLMGGEAVYNELIDSCDEAYVTRVNADGKAEKFFPDLDARAGWKLVERSAAQESNGYIFTFDRYVKK